MPSLQRHSNYHGFVALSSLSLIIDRFALIPLAMCKAPVIVGIITIMAILIAINKCFMTVTLYKLINKFTAWMGYYRNRVVLSSYYK